MILGWAEVDSEVFWAFVRLIRAVGYRGRYTAPYNGRTMENSYLEIGGWCYWFIGPKMLNRCRSELRQHERID